ncbi:hypothetical protein V8F06_004227 [Rhypophila decipiens]
MTASFRFTWAALTTLLLGVYAQDQPQCSCFGLDYTNGGSYLVDGNSDSNFAFTSVFTGCIDSSIIPILVSPDGIAYECTSIETQPDNTDQASQCAITYAEMRSGAWTIIIQSQDFDFTVQRQFSLTVGASNTVTVTETPTITEGVTSTLEPETVTDWIVETETQYEEPEIVTEDCYEDTQTVYQYIPGPTTHIVSTNARWLDVESRTYDNHYPSAHHDRRTANYPNHQATARSNSHHRPPAENKLHPARAAAAVADYTQTITETTYTVTQTIVEIETPDPATEFEYVTDTTTFYPPAQTVCDAPDTVTYFYQGAPITNYDIIYVTYYTSATVWVGQTQYTQSTDYSVMTRCSRGGGYYGT